jgi:hypothetical protein
VKAQDLFLNIMELTTKGYPCAPLGYWPIKRIESALQTSADGMTWHDCVAVRVDEINQLEAIAHNTALTVQAFSNKLTSVMEDYDEMAESNDNNFDAYLFEESKKAELMTENADLRKQLKRIKKLVGSLFSSIGTRPSCVELHHSNEERHGVSVACPVEKRVWGIIDELKKETTNE